MESRFKLEKITTNQIITRTREDRRVCSPVLDHVKESMISFTPYRWRDEDPLIVIAGVNHFLRTSWYRSLPFASWATINGPKSFI